jgi:hypothetical protein
VTHTTRLGIALLATVLAVCLGTLVVPSAGTVPARGFEAGSGSTRMPDQVLRKGCRAYTYTYRLTPATDDWQAEMFLLDPDRRRVSAGALDSGAESEKGWSTFWLCRRTTRYGVFKIRGRLTTYDGWDQSSTWITPSYVRLHRWGR